MEARLLAAGEGDVLVAAAVASEDEPIDVARAQALLADPMWVAAVAFDPQPVGLAYGHVLKLLEGDSLLLYSIGVGEAHRRRGCGRAMLEALKAFCSDRGLFEMWVLTNRSNAAAMRLYSSAGGYDKDPDVVMFEWATPGTSRR